MESKFKYEYSYHNLLNILLCNPAVVAIFAGSVTANLTTNYRMPITFHDLLFNWIFGYSRYAEWYVFSHKVTENNYFKRTQKYLFVAYLFVPLFICAYFRYSQVWFQNQRAKMKKIQKKARQENKNNKEDECSEDKSQKTKVKEEEQSKNSF